MSKKEIRIDERYVSFKNINCFENACLVIDNMLRVLENPKNIEDVPLTVAMPAFMISDLKTAFEIGFLLYLPFLVIDMVVSSVLMAMGMMMLPPVMISLPFKLLIFVLVDGWNLLVGKLVESFH